MIPGPFPAFSGLFGYIYDEMRRPEGLGLISRLWMTGMATRAIGRPAAVISERDLNLEQRVQDAVGRSVGRSVGRVGVGR